MHTPDPTYRQLTEHIRAAGADRTQLRVRGGGSKDFYGHPLQGAVLDTSGLRGITSYEPSELVVTVQAGTPLAELEAVLAEQGQCLAFEPPRYGAASTVGGMVASGLAGPARATAGSVRDYVLGARFINGKGELLTFGGQVMKNVAGYDVSRLLVGSMGTLGVITEVSLKVLPTAPAEATLMCAGLAQTQALAQLHRWGGQPLPLNASCWVWDGGASPAQDYLFVRLRGAAAAVQAAIPRMSADLQAQGGQVLLMDNAQAGPDWNACRDQTLPFFDPPSPTLCLWRLSVPPTAPALNLPYAELVEWQGGLRWLWAPAAAALDLRAAAQAVGGHATLFRTSLAYGEADKTVGAFTALTPVHQQLQTALQQQFDPAGVFNTARLFTPH